MTFLRIRKKELIKYRGNPETKRQVTYLSVGIKFTLPFPLFLRWKHFVLTQSRRCDPRKKEVLYIVLNR
jgi:hypothetical protein